MTLSMLAKISAAYLGLAVSVGAASALWETGQNMAMEYGPQLADSSSPG